MDVLTVPGSLQVGTGQLETPRVSRECRMVGDDLRPISFGLIAEETSRQMAERIADRGTPAKTLGDLLGIPLCRLIRGTRGKGEEVGNVEPVQREVISEYAARALLAAYEMVVGRFRRSRDTVGAGELLRSFCCWMGSAWIIAWAVTATHYEIDWGPVGFGKQGLVLDGAESVFRAVQAKEPMAVGVVCAVTVLCYAVFKPFLAVPRRWSFWRLVRDLLGCLVVGLLLFYLTREPILEVVAADIYREPRLREVLAGAVKAAAILPELALFSLLACLLWVRARQDKRIRTRVMAIGDFLLKEELVY